MTRELDASSPPAALMAAFHRHAIQIIDPKAKSRARAIHHGSAAFSAFSVSLQF